jgi:hypothetical protein
MVWRSAAASSRCVAKQWRKVCGWTAFLRPARWAASLQAFQTTLVSIGVSPVCQRLPGNSHALGLRCNPRQCDRNFFRKMARRENPIRFLVALPDNLEDIAWRPTREEVLLARLAQMKAGWDREGDERRRRRSAEIAVAVAADSAWLEPQNEIEAEECRVRNWYLSELEKEEKAKDEQRRKKLKELSECVNRDMVRAEREALIS